MLEVTATSDEGFATETSVRDFTQTIDATGEESPDTLETLLETYAACYVPALRVGAEQRGVDDLGRVAIDVEGGLNDDDKLDAISFDIAVEADVDDETAESIVERAHELCKVHDALKASLAADATLEGDAF